MGQSKRLYLDDMEDRLERLEKIKKEAKLKQLLGNLTEVKQLFPNHSEIDAFERFIENKISEVK